MMCIVVDIRKMKLRGEDTQVRLSGEIAFSGLTKMTMPMFDEKLLGLICYIV
jgi:hypothetical protein